MQRALDEALRAASQSHDHGMHAQPSNAAEKVEEPPQIVPSSQEHDSERHDAHAQEHQKGANGEAPEAQPTRRKKKPKPLWAEYVDPATGTPYFHNRLTKVTQWERPDESELGLYLYPDGSVR
jgi:hypothetical protein